MDFVSCARLLSILHAVYAVSYDVSLFQFYLLSRMRMFYNPAAMIFLSLGTFKALKYEFEQAVTILVYLSA